MFNLNMPSAPSLLGVDNGGVCTTPKTPEILNSLIAMTNPLDNYTFSVSPTGMQATNQQVTQSINNHQIISQDSSHSSCSGSPLDSPTGPNTTPSVQQTCSQLIKAGLKLSIQSKRKMSSGDSSSGNEASACKNPRKSITGDTSEEDIENNKSPKLGLTPEDEDRRKRRRERNKIAATKCRMKKRERTLNLVSESEQLETQNIDMKSQVRNLERERRKLFDMLQSHGSTCIRPGGYHPPGNLCQSPACKYLNEIGLGDQSNDQQIQDTQQQPQQRTAIPPMATIKYSRNGLRQNHHQQQAQQQQQTSTSGDLLVNGYCKPSPPTQELGYLNSPTQDVTIAACLQQQITVQASLQSQQTQQQQHSIHSPLMKNDYIPNCENSNGGTTVDSTTDFVLKSELVDAQSPYTTVQSADRFLFETDCENFDIKHSHNNNNNNTLDFHPHLSTTPTNCQVYDNLLIKSDFLADNSELLAQLTDPTDSEFTDLDSGVTAYAHMTNGGCIA